MGNIVCHNHVGKYRFMVSLGDLDSMHCSGIYCVLTFSMAVNQRPVNKEGEPSEPGCKNVGWLWLYKH